MDFAGKIAVVTGAGSGIGLAGAREFFARRAAVAVVDRDVSAGRGRVFAADLGRKEEVERPVSKVISRLGAAPP